MIIELFVEPRKNKRKNNIKIKLGCIILLKKQKCQQIQVIIEQKKRYR
jgi:hypothetical protein